MIAVVALAAATSLRVRSSGADFAATTRNEGNLFAVPAIELDLDVRDGAGRTARLFLDGDDLYPGLTLDNCMTVRATAATGTPRLRLYARAGNDMALAGLFDLTVTEGVRDGDPSQGCLGFRPTASLFSGSLAELTADHPDFERGLALTGRDRATVLRVTGSVRDTNAAQGLSARYDIVLEVQR